MASATGEPEMATKGRPFIGKRQKEQARRERRKRKAERRAERRENRADAPRDPLDISGIVAGPQPVPDDDGEE